MAEKTKLDAKDWKILKELDSNCRQSDAQIGKKVGMSQQVVTYRIGGLMKSGIIKEFFAVIDVVKTGYSLYKVYFKFQNITEAKEEKIKEFFINHKNLVWVFGCDGAWDFGITLLAKSAMEFDGLMKEFLGKFSENILYKSVFLLVNAEHFIRGSKETKVLEFEEYEMELELDDIDKKILSILSTNARMPYIEISKSVKIGLDVVRYRMKKLVENGILKGFRVWLDLNLVERHLYKILISLQNISPEKEKVLLDYCKNNRNVTFILKLVGNWDMEMEFIVKNNKEFHDKVIEIRNKFQEIIRSYEPLLVLDEFKANYYPLLK